MFAAVYRQEAPLCLTSLQSQTLGFLLPVLLNTAEKILARMSAVTATM
jgi:hypothetical protein